MAKRMPKQKPGASKQDYATPKEFILAACRKLQTPAFGFDVAATRGVNNVAEECFTVENDALVHDWPHFLWNWLNPPFDDITPWVKKAYMQSRLGACVAVLVPASSGANWWKLWVDGKARVLQLNGRITFVGESDAYPKDCALLVYTPPLTEGFFEPGYEVWSWQDELTEEERMAAKQARPKKPKTKGGGGESINARAETPINQPVGTGKSNEIGGGDILLPGPDDALRLLAELAGLNDQAIAAGKIYADLKERTKAAKEKYDALAEQVLTRLQVGTHKSDLPLFSLDEREADQARMLAAPEATQDAPDAIQNDEQVEGDVIPTQPVTDALDAIQTDPAEVPGIF